MEDLLPEKVLPRNSCSSLQAQQFEVFLSLEITKIYNSVHTRASNMKTENGILYLCYVAQKEASQFTALMEFIKHKHQHKHVIWSTLLKIEAIDCFLNITLLLNNTY
jgi:hypothetical protein